LVQTRWCVLRFCVSYRPYVTSGFPVSKQGTSGFLSRERPGFLVLRQGVYIQQGVRELFLLRGWPVASKPENPMDLPLCPAPRRGGFCHCHCHYPLPTEAWQYMELIRARARGARRLHAVEPWSAGHCGARITEPGHREPRGRSPGPEPEHQTTPKCT
jgi:hypothetical protein